MKSFTDIFLGLWSKRSSCNFTEQPLFFHSCECHSCECHLFNKCDQKVKQVKSRIITGQILEEKLKQMGL